MFLTIKKKSIIAVLLCVLVVAGVVLALFLVRPASSPKPQYTIVIDAGHGGRDVKLGHTFY